MALTSAVTEHAFATRRQGEWNELDMLVRKAQGRGWKHVTPGEVARIPSLYRDVCADLARAQAARYSGPLVEYLQGLTASAHSVLYGAHAKGRLFTLRGGTVRDAFEAFPRAVRKHWLAMTIAFLLFFGPF